MFKFFRHSYLMTVASHEGNPAHERPLMLTVSPQGRGLSPARCVDVFITPRRSRHFNCFSSRRMAKWNSVDTHCI